MEIINKRAISDAFYEKLKNEFSAIIDLINSDRTLDLEFRGNVVMIYYRGSKLAEITEKSEIICNMQYCRIKDDRIKDKPSKEYFIDYIPLYKQKIDIYLATVSENAEKEAEQIIVKENNYSGIANSTDYYILDTEYEFQCDECNARPDLLAIEWKSCQESRRNNQGLCLTFIELKYGDGAVNGRAGIKKHIEDYLFFCKHPEVLKSISEDMQKVFEHKVNLGLIPSFRDKHKHWKKDCQITIDHEKPEMLFMFANSDPESDKIKNEIEECLKSIQDSDRDKLSRIYIVDSSMVGYGLYKYDKDKMTVRYRTLEQFYNDFL